ncbi:hypothetical protein [Pseudoalteromonas citrea]|uniref:hypothetical protein n=1 Tax=Pseudoalteromonas citrea TaxID=43655 RepID=UPI00186782DC|nr:hypothetical protein [Pseudoalteromonas citrea]
MSLSLIVPLVTLALLISVRCVSNAKTYNVSNVLISLSVTLATHVLSTSVSNVRQLVNASRLLTATLVIHV